MTYHTHPQYTKHMVNLLMVLELLVSPFPCQLSKQLCHLISSSKHKHHGLEHSQSRGIYIDENNLFVFLWRKKWGEQMNWHSFVTYSTCRSLVSQRERPVLLGSCQTSLIYTNAVTPAELTCGIRQNPPLPKTNLSPPGMLNKRQRGIKHLLRHFKIVSGNRKCCETYLAYFKYI